MFKKLLGVLIYGFIGYAYADDLSVAVASNFAEPMKKLAVSFEQETGHKLLLSFGASGKFYAQIKNGAPFQVFLSADQEKPAALEKEGFVVPDSSFTYALGALALWSRNLELNDKGADVLRSGKFNKLALANPRLAPYGVAAVEVLENLQLQETTQAKWVMGENIAQTWQFVSTGNADLGFVALSQIITEGKIKKGSAWIVPSPLYHPIKQDVVLLRRGENNRAARELLDFLRGEKATQIIEAWGYTTPAN